MIAYIIKTFSSALPDPDVTISGPTTAAAGEHLVLTCTVRVIERLVSEPSVEWSGGSVGRGDGVMQDDTTHNGAISVRTLTFSPLLTTHGDLYTCMVVISDQSINLLKTNNRNTHMIVQS